MPSDTQVYPTHGFGSFCSATPASAKASTIADEMLTNPALTDDEQKYVAELLAGLSDYPAYYEHMGVINTVGPAPVDLSLPERVDPVELLRRIDAGQWVVDLRSRTAFAAGHLAGSRGFELSDSFVAYLGWLYEWGEPLTLIGENTDQISEARRELVRIGIDGLDGAAVGDVVVEDADSPHARAGGDADDADVVVERPDRAGDVRAVVVPVAPGIGVRCRAVVAAGKVQVGMCADAGVDYRDVGERIKRLTVQAA